MIRSTGGEILSAYSQTLNMHEIVIDLIWITILNGQWLVGHFW